MKSMIVAFSLVFLSFATAEARIWRVNTLGTGDAPNIYAAMDSAQDYDTVLLEAGTYNVPTGLSVTHNVNLVGEAGAANTLVYRDDPYAPDVVSLLSGSSISGIHVRGNTYVVLFSHWASPADHCIVESLFDLRLVQGEGGVPRLTNCLFIGGEIGMPAYFVSCILYSDLDSYAIGSRLIGCDILGYVGPGIDASPYDLNFTLDPQFCGLPGSGNYFLKSTSPCLPGNNPFGSPVLTGPLGVGCGAVAVRPTTWGAVKALYRTP